MERNFLKRHYLFYTFTRNIVCQMQPAIRQSSVTKMRLYSNDAGHVNAESVSAKEEFPQCSGLRAWTRSCENVSSNKTLQKVVDVQKQENVRRMRP